MKQEHFEILLEEMRGHFQLLGEGLQGVNQRLDRHEQRFDILEQKIDRLEIRVGRVEARLDKLEAKVDKLAKGQREMKKQLDQVIELVTDHGDRLERLEHPAA